MKRTLSPKQGDHYLRALLAGNRYPMGDDAKEIFVNVRDFSDFNEDNDPYGEHDFGSFTVSGVKVFWKMDYYDEASKGWCDPLSPNCNWVLTIMRADEY